MKLNAEVSRNFFASSAVEERFQSQETTTKRGSKKREYFLAQEPQRSGECGVLYYLFLATSVFTHHQNMIQVTRGSLIVRWLL